MLASLFNSISMNLLMADPISSLFFSLNTLASDKFSRSMYKSLKNYLYTDLIKQNNLLIVVQLDFDHHEEIKNLP